MDREEIFRKLNTIFKDILELDEVELGDNTTADDIDEWDSLSHIQLIVAVEKEFGIKFSSFEIKSLTDVGDFVNCIISKLKKKPVA